MTSPDGTAAAVPPADPWASPPTSASPPPPLTPSAVAPAEPPADRPPSWSGAEWAFPAPPAPPSTNSWAVVALVTGLLGLVPVAVPAGIAGIVQTSRRRQAGRRLAVAGLVTAALWTVGLVVLVVTVGASWDPREGTPADLGAVAVGDCLDRPVDGSSTWTSAACTSAHDAEVYLVDELGGDDWPGGDVVEGRADDACSGAFSDYVGRSWFTSVHDYAWFSPQAGEWADGERRVVCVVVPPEEDQLRAPVRGSGG